MAARSTFRTRPIAVLLLISVTLIIMDRAISGPTDWLRSVTQDAFAGSGSALSSAWPFGQDNELQTLQSENSALRQQLQEAQGSLFATQDLRRQYESLAALSNLPTPNNVSKVVAQVTATGMSNFDSAIEISKGTKDGVAIGMPVATGAGLVGRVVQVSSSRSTVLMMTDSTFEVGIRFGSTGDIAVAVGQGPDEALRGDLVDLDSTIAIGEVAVTNGQQGSIFPPGLPVALVANSEATGQDLRRVVTLTPIADLQHLDLVAVLLWNAPT